MILDANRIVTAIDDYDKMRIELLQQSMTMTLLWLYYDFDMTLLAIWCDFDVILMWF